MGPGPLLGVELLAGIDQEAAAALVLRLPDVAAGPNPSQSPERTGPERPGRPDRRRFAAPQQQGAALLGGGGIEHSVQKGQRLTTDANLRWHPVEHPGTLWTIAFLPPSMSDLSTEAKETVESTVESVNNAVEDQGFDFSQRYGDVIGKVNETLDKVDWSQLGKAGKVAGILLAVIVAQILIKGVLDTINLLPIIPGLLELLGLVVVGTWSWENLTTSEKRNAVVDQLQTLKKEYLG
jgi:hypothetical protein